MAIGGNRRATGGESGRSLGDFLLGRCWGPGFGLQGFGSRRDGARYSRDGCTPRSLFVSRGHADRWGHGFDFAGGCRGLRFAKFRIAGGAGGAGSRFILHEVRTFFEDGLEGGLGDAENAAPPVLFFPVSPFFLGGASSELI